MFNKYIINTPKEVFSDLLETLRVSGSGRIGEVFVDCENNLIPIVRTTSVYDEPVKKFLPIHYQIMDNIKKVVNGEIVFNNALVEVYDSRYRTMKFHSDQSLDLADNSYICLFSCYENNNLQCDRKLRIKDKISKDIFEILLDNNSIVLFSTETNKKFVHQIVLDSNTENRWLGITFRLSKTFINFVDNVPYFFNTDKILRIANDEEKKEFIKYKGIENSKIGFEYPEICYTISKSDTKNIIK